MEKVGNEAVCCPPAGWKLGGDEAAGLVRETMEEGGAKEAGGLEKEPEEDEGREKLAD